MMDAASESKLSGVDAALADRIRQLASILLSQYGTTLHVVSGLRTYGQQASLYANRASNRNPVAAPGTSKHEKGLAVDITLSGGRANISTAGAIGESLGLTWGGRFSKPDPGHFELRSGAALLSGDYAMPVIIFAAVLLILILD